MATLHTHTLTVTIDAPLVKVAADLADPTTHPDWATEFYAGPVRPAAGGDFIAPVPMMGGQVRHRIDADIAPGAPGPLLRPPGRGLWPADPGPAGPQRRRVDVLWTLARFPGVSDQAWQQGLAAMARELQALKRRHEAQAPHQPSTHPVAQPARRTPRRAGPGGRSGVLLDVPQEPATRQAMDALGARLWSQPEPHHCRFRRPRSPPYGQQAKVDSSPPGQGAACAKEPP
jgi:hypothetical protein